MDTITAILTSLNLVAALGGAFMFFGMIAFISILMPTRGRSSGEFGLLGGGIALIGLFMILGGHFAHDYVQGTRPYAIMNGSEFDTSEFQPIISLADGQAFSMSGHGSAGFAFVIGYGSMDIQGQTTPQYVFYKVVGNGSYMLDTLPAAGVVIREDGGDNPEIERVYHHSITDLKVYTDNGDKEGGDQSVSQTATIIHVPKGTIIRDYKLDSNLGSGT